MFRLTAAGAGALPSAWQRADQGDRRILHAVSLRSSGDNPDLVADASYDRLGRGYSARRATDPRIAAAIDAALGDARSVVNVGAGTGSYEPAGREVIAVEPSAVMIAQRPEGSAPAIQAAAEALPFEDDSVDAAMAIFTDHHWSDRATGIREMARVARKRVVVLNVDPARTGRFWLVRDYLRSFLDLVPEPYREDGYWEGEFRDLLGEVALRPVPVPHDCCDGFFQAYWRRPEAYLDEGVRKGISVFHVLPEDEVDAAIEQLRADLGDGTWEARNAELLEATELDIGLRLVTGSL
jgi:SAM-dependent methyltransferase